MRTEEEIREQIEKHRAIQVETRQLWEDEYNSGSPDQNYLRWCVRESAAAKRVANVLEWVLGENDIAV